MEVALISWCLIPSIYLAYTDWKKRILYDYITLPMFFIGLFFTIFIIGNTLNALLGFLLCSGIMLFVGLNGGVGGGDIKLIGALGLWFGMYYGPIEAMYMLILGSLLCSLYGFYRLIVEGKFKERMSPFFKSIWIKLAYDKTGEIYMKKLPEEGLAEDGIPFGTFIVIGAWLWFLLF